MRLSKQVLKARSETRERGIPDSATRTVKDQEADISILKVNPRIYEWFPVLGLA